jgi:NAD(P)-dependent dehydrogenase (short-subunit alcohol dehydrogenase family)
MKTAIVTGAGTGIGRAAALALLNDGWRVGLVGRRKDALAATAAGHANALVLPADVTKPAEVRAAFDRLERVDLLFNNAGTFSKPVPFDELTDETWLSVVDVNLNGMFYCAREAFRRMKAQSPKGGRIINNGSISADRPRPRSAPYTATKHAVTGLTKSLSLDGRAHDIACSQIDIGNAATDMTRKMTEGVPQADGSTRVEPRMDVAHVASAILYMANLPLEANVQFMTIMATKMPLIGRG